MNSNFNRYANFARHCTLITNADTDLFTDMYIRCNVAGTAVVTPSQPVGGTAVTITMVVGEVLPFLVKRVAAASTGTFHGMW